MKPVLIFLASSLIMWGTLLADTMYGAFKVVTKPSGADVTLYEPDLYLAQTPTPVYPVVMDEYMELREGIPGRAIPLVITHKGYLPMEREIFVPFTHEADSLAMAEASVFTFELEPDIQNKYWRVSVYYSYPYRHPKPHYHAHYYPWYPPPRFYHPAWYQHPPQLRPPAIAHLGDIVSGSSGQGAQIGAASRNKLKPQEQKPPKYEQKEPPAPSKTKAPTQTKSPAKVQTNNKPQAQTKAKPATKSKAESPGKAQPAAKSQQELKAKPAADNGKPETSKSKQETPTVISSKTSEEPKLDKAKPSKSK